MRGMREIRENPPPTTDNILPSAPVPQIERRRSWLIGCGGALFALSIFLPWAHVVLVGNVTLWQVAQLTHHQGAAELGVAVGLALTVCALAMPFLGEAVRVIAGIAAVAGAYVAYQAVKGIDQLGGFASVGVGVFAAVLAGILLLVGAILSSERSRI